MQSSILGAGLVKAASDGINSAKAATAERYGVREDATVDELAQNPQYIKDKFHLTDEDYAKYEPYIKNHPYATPGYHFGDLIRNAGSSISSGRTAYLNDWWNEILKDYREGESARKANDYQAMREDTAYQRTARDARLAGLNPWVLMQGGASPMSVNSSHKASTSKEDDSSSDSNALMKILGLVLLAMSKGKSKGPITFNNYR